MADTPPRVPIERSTPPPTANQAESILGLSTGDLAGLSVEEITGNKVAITMIIHYYKQLVDHNTSLKNDINSLRTYFDGYRAKKQNAEVGAGLQFLGAILLAFGVNLLTGNPTPAAWMTFAGGIVTQVFGLFYSLREIS